MIRARRECAVVPRRSAITRVAGRPPAVVLVACAILSSALAHAQIADRISVRAAAEALLPVFGDQAYFTPGGGGVLTADFAALPFLHPLVSVGLAAEGIRGSDVLTLAQAGLGAAAVFAPLERLSLRLEGLGGLYAAYVGNVGASNFFLSAAGEVGFRVSPSITIAARGGIGHYLGPGAPLLTAATAGLSATLHVGGLAVGGGRVRIEDVQAGSVYPVFYSYYDDHPFGSLSLVNGEPSQITDVRVSLSIGRYMDQPKGCAQFPAIERGGRVEVPLYALFTDEVLSLTESTRAPGEIIVDYSLMGSHRQVRAPLVQRFFHRNAMNWDDDRKAAAFVSARDPAAQWFAKYVSGIVRSRARAGISTTLQLAMGLFETERLFGLAYVVDPSSSYVEKSANESAVDSLQFPHQTLFYRGGDCDDMSILFSALLEAVGVKTAFITIPGHIFMAFEVGMSEAEAREAFFDPSLLIFRDGRAWVPVEITMVKEGFVKAWRVGAKEWADNRAAGTAGFFPMEESWSMYPPVGIPDVNPRFSLPDEALVIQAFDDAVNRYVAREIDTAVREYRARLKTDESPETANELGILLGRNGLLKEAWAQFTVCARAPRVYGWTNLANVAFLRGDYALAVSYYEWAISQDPKNAVAVLGLARSSYEMERFDRAGTAYAQLAALDSKLAGQYGYLASAVGGEGRAWSFADRLSTMVWDQPSRVVAALPQPVQAPPVEPVAPVAQAPQPEPVQPPAPQPEPAQPPAPQPERPKFIQRRGELADVVDHPRQAAAA